MRIGIAIAAILLLVTVGCGERGGNGQQQANGLPVSASPQGNQAYHSDVNRNAWRNGYISSCVWGGQARAARGTGTNPRDADFWPYCTCVVDRVMAGVETARLESLRFGAREQAVAAQCAREHGLRPDPQVSEDVGGPFPDLAPESSRP